MSTPDPFPPFSKPTASRPVSGVFPAQPARRPGLFSRLWAGWLWLTGPNAAAFSDGLAAQERLRRSRLISALLVLVVLTVALIVPSALANQRNWFPVIILTIGGLLVGVLNNWGAITLSAAAYVALVDAAIVGFLVMKPTLSTGNIPDLDLLLLAVLVGGMVLPRQFILLTGAVQVALILIIFQAKPHDPLLTQQIQTQQSGQVYTALVAPLVLQVCGTGIAWLHAWSMGRALVRADRAEELAAAERHIADQARQILEQKARLEEGIARILETHRQIAAGNLTAQAPIPEEHELWQIGRALNNLLGRFQRQTQENQELALACQEVEELALILEARQAGQRLSYPRFQTSLGNRLLQVLGI